MAIPAQTRYTRCRYAVGDVLTDIMREYLMYSKIPLTVIYKKIMGDDKFRKKLKQREIGQIQTLESHGFADIDISLMFKIARYHKFAMIIPDEPSHGWDSFPLETDNTFCDNILRIKSCRNEINHNPNTALSQNEFRRMFKMYIDIGRRADEHLSKDNNHFTHRVENYETCSLDKEMEEKYKGEIENLKKIVESNPRPDITVKTYASKETQTKIDQIRAEELFEETSSAKITVSGIENAAKQAKQLNDQKDHFKTDYIEMKKATNGSLVLFLTINNRLFKDDMMESELERFVKTLFVTADLQCIQNHQCNIVLELEDAESDTEESENEDDIVLHVEIKNGAFKTDESLSQDLDQFISNVVTNANGKPPSCHKEITAVLDISNKEKTFEDSTPGEEKLKDEAKASENNIPDDMKEIAQFLIRNELQHLKEKFEMEEITIPALLQMNDADLKEIGIKKGPRVLLLAAKKELQENTGADMEYQFEAEIDDVEKFLKSLNLQYLEDCFKGQDVTINALREMDADDLVDLGVNDVSTRSKILDATKVLKPSKEIEIEESDTSDLSKFLRGIGLQKLTPKFEDEEISIEALIKMNDEDLKEIDIKKKGPRVLLLKSANKVKMMRKKTDNTFRQQLRKGDYENVQWIEKEVEKNMEEVHLLLKEINLEALYGVFEKEEITLQVLLEMGHEQLSSVGITKFGHRQKIITAAREREDSLFDDQSVEVYESIGNIQPLGHNKKSRDLPPVPPSNSIQELDDFQGSGKIKERSKSQTLPNPGCGNGRILSLSYQDLATDSQITQSALSKTIFPKDSRMAKSALNLSKTMPAKPIRKYQSTKTAKDSVDILLSKIADFKHKAKNSLLQSYNDIQSLIKNKRLSAEVKDELSVEFGDIEKIISESLKDLNDDFCPIVITGETSAGKSSFVNLLLGVELLPKHSLTCTSTICRIYNKEEKSIVLITGKDYKKEVPLQGDADTAEVQDLLRKHGSKPVSSPTENIPDEGSDALKYIDINWPIPALQEHMLIVDTPGIGPDNPELTERLYQYLPKALAFIYVINTPNAGGIQSDRIFQIRDVLMKQNQDEHMSVFDPERAIFICNKWDQIHEEPDKVFQIVQDTLDESWIGFDPDKLYRLSAREEMQNSLDGNPVSQDFTDILKGIESMIPATIREKYHRHLHWQRKFIERLLMKLSTRIRNSHKSKQDKKEMRENIRKRIQSVKENLLLKKQAVQSKAKTQSKEIAKNVFDHLQSKDTFDRMFKWTEDDLPSHGNIHEIKRVIDKLVFDYITQELRKKLQETEVSKLSDMIEHLFKSECFLIDRECETIDGILLGEEETCISRKINALDRSTSFELSDIGLKGTKGKILLAVSSPFILAFGLILLPVGVTCVISDKLNNEMKLSEYNSDKISFANKRAEKMLTKLSVQVLNTTIEDSLLKKINFRITEFFYKEIPRRINAGDKLMENISKDLRQPREIRKHSYSMQKDVMPVYGQIIFASMAVFGENITKSDHIAETKGVATIKLNNEKITVAVKSMRYKKNNNDKYTSTAEVYSMRDLHHQNVVKFYGICPFNDHVLEGFDFFTEYCGENLDNKVFDEHIRWRKSLHYIKDGLEGLIYLHQSGIVHRNIRLAAILIKDGEAKLSDGGITMRKILKGNISGGVPIVRAPEVLLCDYCGHESDMFQVGIVLWEAFYTKRAFLDKSAKTTYEELIKRIVNGERPSLVDPYPQITIRHKIEDCWEKGLDERPSAKDVRDVITAFIESSPIAN